MARSEGSRQEGNGQSKRKGNGGREEKQRGKRKCRSLCLSSSGLALPKHGAAGGKAVPEGWNSHDLQSNSLLAPRLQGSKGMKDQGQGRGVGG